MSSPWGDHEKSTANPGSHQASPDRGRSTGTKTQSCHQGGSTRLVPQSAFTFLIRCQQEAGHGSASV